jgi:hypothetical protein
MISKEKIIQTVKDLSGGFSIDDLFERILLLQKIELGLEQSNRGKQLPRKRLRKDLAIF